MQELDWTSGHPTGSNVSLLFKDTQSWVSHCRKSFRHGGFPRSMEAWLDPCEGFAGFADDSG